jgi:hypothetical protein
MIDFDLDFNLARNRSESTKLSLLAVVMTGVKLSIFVGKLNACDQEVILLIRSMSA